jgi:hypothetical protein
MSSLPIINPVVTSLLAEDEDEEQLQQPKQAASPTQHSSVMRMMIETVFGDDEDLYPPAVMAAPTIPTWMMEQQPSPRNKIAPTTNTNYYNYQPSHIF